MGNASAGGCHGPAGGFVASMGESVERIDTEDVVDNFLGKQVEVRPAVPACTSIFHSCVHSATSIGLDDQTCANVLLAKGAYRGDMDDVKAALSQGAQVNTRARLGITFSQPMNRKTEGSLTPLMRACRGGHQEIVFELLRLKADPHLEDRRKWTALCHALATGEFSVASLLVTEVQDAAKLRQGVQRVRAGIERRLSETLGVDGVEALDDALDDALSSALSSSRGGLCEEPLQPAI